MTLWYCFWLVLFSDVKGHPVHSDDAVLLFWVEICWRESLGLGFWLVGLFLGKELLFCAELERV